MSTYAWIITHVNTKELGQDCADEVGVAGPSDATAEQIERARKEGFPFRMRDDDGIWYYRGKLFIEGADAPGGGWSDRLSAYIVRGGLGDDEESFGPLWDFGTPNAGCTSIQFRVSVPAPGKEDEWVLTWAEL